MNQTLKNTIFALLVVSIVSGSAISQINLLSDAITFRTSGQNAQKTTHWGDLDVFGGGTSSPATLNVVSQYTGTVFDRSGIFGSCIGRPGYGTGGKFRGGKMGVLGYATENNSTTAHYGGQFLAQYGSSNYGVYASALVQANSYAGYFSGDLVYTNAFYKYSDGRLKNNEEILQGSLVKVLKLKPKSYNYDTTGRWHGVFSSKKQFGLIAQEIEEIFPEMVTEITPPMDSTEEAAIRENGNANKRETYKAVDYIALIPVLINAMQEQQIQIDELKKTVKILRGY